VTLGDLGDRFGAVFPITDENMMGLLRNNLVYIADNGDFRLTDDGNAECRNRRRISISMHLGINLPSPYTRFWWIFDFIHSNSKEDKAHL
jgi:hypothetical protein